MNDAGYNHYSGLYIFEIDNWFAYIILFSDYNHNIHQNF